MSRAKAVLKFRVIGRVRPRDAVSRSAVRRFTTHLGIRLRRILRCAASGASGSRLPLDSRLFWGDGTGACARPPTSLILPSWSIARLPIFVKKKFIPAGGAETATQKVPDGFCCAHTLCGARNALPAGRSFFLYEKSGLRESDSLRGRKSEVCTDLTRPLFPPLKSP